MAPLRRRQSHRHAGATIQRFPSNPASMALCGLQPLTKALIAASHLHGPAAAVHPRAVGEQRGDELHQGDVPAQPIGACTFGTRSRGCARAMPARHAPTHSWHPTACGMQRLPCLLCLAPPQHSQQDAGGQRIQDAGGQQGAGGIGVEALPDGDACVSTGGQRM